MRQKELQKILEGHIAWLWNKENGERADLTGADLCDADLEDSCLCRADLSGARLQDTNLQGADLEGANLANTCWPLSEGGLDVRVDKDIAAQLAYYFCRLDCDDPEYLRARNGLLNFANQFHSAKEWGELELIEKGPAPASNQDQNK